MWVFGYGSLLWKVEFPYEQKLIGHVEGFHRRFYQYSIDHRGTPEQPGRVVTLVPTPDKDAYVYGVAYEIRNDKKDEIMKQLDYREKGGYKRMQTMFYPNKANILPFELTLYVGTEDNILYAGEADLDSIAREIVSSKGPSGSNLEYLCTLAKSMRTIAPGITDEHLFGLETKALNLTK
ncbi:cation transport protein chac-related [Holotrichia oblita]|uniref:Cation transport protein chac-related n=2 Tax=Holotrichia oblita TaxID=644536 RepID=A0ACB9T3K2_HOLOL|nr:cation transport protein chac-related [Holotrichia oblita]KAI4461392.1 cation transport protein chac-related [Holotrichia oblita]